MTFINKDSGAEYEVVYPLLGGEVVIRPVKEAKWNISLNQNNLGHSITLITYDTSEDQAQLIKDYIELSMDCLTDGGTHEFDDNHPIARAFFKLRQAIKGDK